MPATLIEVSPYDPVGAAVVTLRAGTDDDARVCALNGQSWFPVLMKPGNFGLDLFDASFPGFASVPTAKVELDLSVFPDAGRYSWGDRPVKLWTAEPGTAWPWPQLFEGLVQAATVKDGRLALTLRVNDAWLDRPVLASYAGTGAAEGPAALRGAAKPLALGAPKYVAPQLVDTVKNVWQFHGAGSARAVVAALDRLVRYPASVGNFASFANLVAASIPAGQFGTCLAQGLVRFGAPPDGPLTLIVEGDNGSTDGWVRRPGALIKRIALLAGATTGQLNLTNLTALDTAAPYNLSLFVTAQTTARELIARVAASVNGLAMVNLLGQLQVILPQIGTPALTLAADGTAEPQVTGLELLETGAPWWRTQLSGDICWRPHAPGDYFDAMAAEWGRVTGTGRPADNATRNVVTYGATAPASPIDGDLWVNTSGTFAVFNLRVAGTWQVGANALSAYNALSGRPVALADINTTESSKLSGIEAGATAGAPFGSFLAGVPVEIARSATPTSMMEDWGSYVSASVAQAAWNFGPAGAVSIISGSGFTAGRALQVTGACVIIGKHRAAFDFDALYRVKVRAQVSTLGSGNSHFVGITAFDSTGTELAFPDSGVYHYPAGGNTPAATGTFEWEGYFRGVAVPGTGANVGGTARNPSEATPIRAGAVMIAPVFLANQGGSGGVIRIDYMTIEKVEDLVTATPTLQVPPTLTFDANFSGGLIAGQVPRAYTATRRRGHLDVSGSTAWSLVTSGCTASISTGGIVTVTACTAPGFIDVTSARNGVTLTARTSILRPTAPPPNVADSTASTTTIGAVSSNTYGTVHAGPFNVTAGSAGQIALSAPLSYSTLGGLPTGTFGLLGKWQIQIGGTWTDVAAEVAQSSNDVVLDEGWGFSLAIGAITINQTATGLTPGTSYPCRLLMRTPSGTRPRYPFGTAVGVGS